ncbi:MAG: cellobiose phosphorylase [Actinobacteria bacterium HGW-Actinobacteria-4]|nr:MAG: cellobiose phosphorylase [Actinobacteria bacterium HGW-Actinobacteria-4]
MAEHAPQAAQHFDEANRFVIENYAAARPFASFLPGIAGTDGIPLWVFYVNRGQAIAAFGTRDKDHAIMEYQPANKAYQQTPYVGFRTFLTVNGTPYEPFSPLTAPTAVGAMAMGMNELELSESSAEHGLTTTVTYFTLPHENFAGLARQVTLTNTSAEPLDIEALDGLPVIIPAGVNNEVAKQMARTVEAWMEVFRLETHAPIFRVRASVGDTAEVETMQGGNFALASLEQGGKLTALPAFVDPVVVFGANSSLSAPAGLAEGGIAELLAKRQITVGRTPSALFGGAFTLAPGESVTIHSVYGHTERDAFVDGVRERLHTPRYLADKRAQGTALATDLTDVIATTTSNPLFDAYARQTFLDNVMRGGWPLTFGHGERPNVYHVYSRKHGDLERDYNAYLLAAEPYSQGNGNFRDVNQNRRSDVWFNPAVGDFNARAFVSFIQADGYNPLVIEGSTFTLSRERRNAVRELAAKPEALDSLLGGSFTPGAVMRYLAENDAELTVTAEQFLDALMSVATQHLEARFGEGHWADHWTYNLDLIESFLGLYPDREDSLLFEPDSVPFFESPVTLQPRSARYVLFQGKAHQFNAVVEDHEREEAMRERPRDRNWLRTQHGVGKVYRTSVFAKLVILALNKFTTLDPSGMAVEMEGGRPGWYDALNGLPGVFGSTMPETFELQRLIRFLRKAIATKVSASDADAGEEFPVEVATLLEAVLGHLAEWDKAGDDFRYWDAVATSREWYQATVRLGIDGAHKELTFAQLDNALGKFEAKVDRGIGRALEMNGGIPPTYFMHQVDAYNEVIGRDGKPVVDAKGRPTIQPTAFTPVVLPLFLEGPVRAFKTLGGVEDARDLHERVKGSALFDAKLQMYKVNASIADLPPDIGRAQAFPAGWLENESIWLHMEYKYLLELLRSGLYAEFFQEIQTTMVPFLDPAIYGRSPLENSSFIVSSAHPDPSLHGAGFVARLSGSTAEFLSIWVLMMAGEKPFAVVDGELVLELKPALPADFFTEAGEVTFTFLGHTQVTYVNPGRVDTFAPGVEVTRTELFTGETSTVIEGGVIGAPHAAAVRAGAVDRIKVTF